jgi:hypothetical protein
MPRGDKTGPNGDGPKTGRALGYCVGNNQAGFEANEATYGRGNGNGFGRRNGNGNGNGFGRGNGYGFRNSANNFTQETILDVKEETLIQNQINILKDQLESLEEKLKTLKK